MTAWKRAWKGHEHEMRSVEDLFRVAALQRPCSLFIKTSNVSVKLLERLQAFFSVLILILSDYPS